jgi:predicted HD phosphohydrolase
MEVFAAIVIAGVFGGYLSLYATLVCVACSQLDKLRAALLDIRQTHVISEQYFGDGTDQQDGQGQTLASQELFRYMQKKLNNCIRHHQEIKRYVHHTDSAHYVDLHIVSQDLLNFIIHFHTQVHASL